MTLTTCQIIESSISKNKMASSLKKGGGVLLNITIIGCGAIGQRVASLYKESNRDIYGIVQSIQSSDNCKKSGITAFQENLDQALSQEAIASVKNSYCYYFAPPPSSGEQDTRLKNFLSNLENAKSFPKRIVLISTTGVYGDSQGEWIDESTPVNPIADRAKRRISAEQTLLNWAEQHIVKIMILRVPGIYAEDRLPLERLRKGLAIVKESEAGFTNRIHADDLALVCKAAMEVDASNEIINVSDGNPSTMTTYFNHVADFADLPRPPQISMEEAEESLSAGMVSYLKESRRIRNDKMLNLLNIKLQYPDLESSLPINKKRDAS